MSKNIPIKLYRLNQTNLRYKRKKSFFNFVCDEILLKVNKKGDIFKLQSNINPCPPPFTNYRYKVFYRVSRNEPYWKDFVSEAVIKGSEITRPDVTRKENYVIIIQGLNNHCYAITGGSGYYAISDYIQSDFGLEVLSYLVDNKSDNIILSTKRTSPVGNLSGSESHFKNEQNFYESEDITSLFKQIKSIIRVQDLQKYFSISIDDDASIICQDSFDLKKSIGFLDVPALIEGCEKIEAGNVITELCFLQKLHPKRCEKEINELNNRLGSSFKSVVQKNSGYEQFVFSPSDFQAFNSASFYMLAEDELVFKPKQEIQEIVRSLIDSHLCVKPYTISSILDAINQHKLISYDDSEERVTVGKLIDHFMFENNQSGKEALFINGLWYKIRGNYLSHLSESCNSFIKSEFENNLLDKTWTMSVDEGDYNELYIGEPDTLVTDRITPDYIEPCDVIKWDANNIYLIHVKEGFDGKIRDLSSQIINAAKHIQMDSRSNYPYLKKLYQAMLDPCDSTYRQRVAASMTQITEDEFLNLFQRKIHFVFAFGTKTNKNQAINTGKGVSKFKSNIAKLCLYSLYREMKSIDMNLKITQIQRV